MAKKNILIFGGAGFLASHLADELTKKSFNVTIFDKKKSSYLQEDQKMIVGDILDFKKVIKACKNQDIIYHFAAVADLQKANQIPLKTLNVNIFGTINILEACIKNGIKKIIFASSIYARSQQGGFYSTSKLSSEMIIERYSEKYPIKYVILRFGSLYGLRSNNSNPITNFIKEALLKKKIIRFSDGKETRSYINTSDLTKICVDFLKKKYENNHINILGNKTFSVRTILNLIKKIIPKTKIVYKNKKMTFNYKKNPFTYKIRKGTTIKLKNEVKLELALNKLVNELKKTVRH